MNSEEKREATPRMDAALKQYGEMGAYEEGCKLECELGAMFRDKVDAEQRAEKAERELAAKDETLEIANTVLSRQAALLSAKDRELRSAIARNPNVHLLNVQARGNTVYRGNSSTEPALFHCESAGDARVAEAILHTAGRAAPSTVTRQPTAWMFSNEEGDDDFGNNWQAIKDKHYAGGPPVPLYAAPQGEKAAPPEASFSAAKAAKEPGNADGDRPAVSAPSSTTLHPETDRCGFDRSESIAQDTYVCLCGFIDGETPNPAPAAPSDTTRNAVLKEVAHWVETRELLFARCGPEGATGAKIVDDIKEYLVRGILGLQRAGPPSANRDSQP